MGNKKWKKYYESITRDHILFFFGLIEQYFIKPKDTQQMKLNKLLLWINFLHSEHQTWFDFSRKWGDICESTVSNYMMDVACAILRAFASTPKIIGFQSQQNIEKMKKILSDSKAAIPYATCLVDGKCTRVLGRKGEHQKHCDKPNATTSNHINRLRHLSGQWNIHRTSINRSFNRIAHNSTINNILQNEFYFDCK